MGFSDMIGGGGDSSSGDRFTMAEHENVLIAVTHPAKKEINTSRGPSDAVACKHIVVLEGAEDGRVFEDQLLWGTVIVPTLTNAAHAIVVGRLTKGEARGGQNAPWLWADASDEEFSMASQWFETNAKVEAGVITIATTSSGPDEEPF